MNKYQQKMLVIIQFKINNVYAEQPKDFVKQNQKQNLTNIKTVLELAYENPWKIIYY